MNITPVPLAFLVLFKKMLSFCPFFLPIATNCFALFVSCSIFSRAASIHLSITLHTTLLSHCSFPRTTFPFPAQSDLSSCFLPFAYPAARSLNMLCQETAICTLQKPARLFVSRCSFPTDTWTVYLSDYH